jgi:transcriptional regulator with XRE-family HTH domain
MFKEDYGTGYQRTSGRDWRTSGLRKWGETMSRAARRRTEGETDPVRVLGRGLRAQRGVHLTLRTLREAAGKTQVDVKEASGIDQGDISRLETRADFDDCQVETLQRYVAALGGHLDLVAVFGDKRIALAGVEKGRESPANKPLQRTTRLPRSARSSRRR